MKFINTNTTLGAQFKKVQEEVEEFIEANDDENLIEEFYDTIQAMLGVIQILGLEQELKEGLKKHNDKLISRGWNLKEI